MQRISIIVPCYHEELVLPKLLERLRSVAGIWRRDYETMCVDDSSTERIREMLQQLKAEVSVLRPIRNTGEHGLGRPVVAGVRRSRGDYKRG
jgi:polyisoprenyl-phosphate glycosyltransferase